jgi:electron transfer flavoprotein alpha subunit
MSAKKRAKAELIPDKCISCAKCEAACPVEAIAYDEQGVPIINTEKCIGCKKCLKACPVEAFRLSYPEGDMVVVQVAPETEEDKSRQMETDKWKGVWVFVEQRNGHAHNVAWQLLGVGAQLAADLGEELSAVVLGSKVDHLADQAFGHGAANVYYVDSPVLEEYRTQPYTEALVVLVKKYLPAAFLMGATAIGRDLGSAVATRLETGLTADCTQLSVDKEKRLLEQTRPAFGGNIMATILSEHARPQMSTVRPEVFAMPAFIEGRQGKLIKEGFTMDESQMLTKIREIIPIKKSGVDIAAADVIISGGRGMTSPEHFKLLNELAELLGGVVAGSRSAVDAGWIGYERQVGQTGKTVRPKLYFACGISGAIQHIVGMQNSEHIIAINRDENAPVFEITDLGVIGDIFETLPDLIDALRKKKEAAEIAGKER